MTPQKEAGQLAKAAPGITTSNRTDTCNFTPASRGVKALLADAKKSIRLAGTRWAAGDAIMTADVLRTGISRLQAAQAIALRRAER